MHRLDRSEHEASIRWSRMSPEQRRAAEPAPERRQAGAVLAAVIAGAVAGDRSYKDGRHHYGGGWQ